MTLFKNIPIQKKLMKVVLLTSGVVLFLTCSLFFAYEYLTFRQVTVSQLSTLGEILAANSTAALAFDSPTDAQEILNALKAERNIVQACIYDQSGQLFAKYPSHLESKAFPSVLQNQGYRFSGSYLEGFQTVVQGSKPLGTLYLKSDLKLLYQRFWLYIIMVSMAIATSTVSAYFISRKLQKTISEPIISLAETAQSVSVQNDYSVRALKHGDDEIGMLTDAFNHMLLQIELQNSEIISFNQKLEEKVIERTHQLEVSNKEMEAFSYSISHDLRAPLRSIDGYSKILLEEYFDKIDDEGKKSLNRIMNSAKMMGRLIDDLLEFSKLGKRELNKGYVDMNDVVQKVLAELHEEIAQRNIDLRVGDLAPSMADIGLIKQVWVNLINNAIKYTKKRERAIIEITSNIEVDTEVTYRIKDNGAGFDMQYANKLFGVFQRLHKEKDFEGTGVGLAIVQRIIIKHGGKIWADAKIDQGACFYFTLSKLKL